MRVIWTENVLTHPELLKESGYFILAPGKCHLGLKPEYRPKACGLNMSFTLLPGWFDYRWEPQIDNPEDLLWLFETVITALHMEDTFRNPLTISTPPIIYREIDWIFRKGNEGGKKPWITYLFQHHIGHYKPQIITRNLQYWSRNITTMTTRAIKETRSRGRRHLISSSQNQRTGITSTINRKRNQLARRKRMPIWSIAWLEYRSGPQLCISNQLEKSRIYSLFLCRIMVLRERSYEALPAVGAQVLDIYGITV